MTWRLSALIRASYFAVSPPIKVVFSVQTLTYVSSAVPLKVIQAALIPILNWDRHFWQLLALSWSGNPWAARAVVWNGNIGTHSPLKTAYKMRRICQVISNQFWRWPPWIREQRIGRRAWGGAISDARYPEDFWFGLLGPPAHILNMRCLLPYMSYHM